MPIVSPVALQSWSFPKSSSPVRAFADPVAFLQAMATGIHSVKFDSWVTSQHKKDRTLASWRRLREPLKTTKAFRAFRVSSKPFQDAASQALPAAAALNAEIARSPIILPAGQLLFRGGLLAHYAPLQRFISTTLSPPVAAVSVAAVSGAIYPPTAYVFTLTRDVPGLWGHVGSSCEWELLLGTGHMIQPVKTHTWPGAAFQVIEAHLT